MLKVNELTFAYHTSGTRHTVFDSLDIDFMQGMNVILGPNGAGKSTLLKVIFGLLKYNGVIYYGKKTSLP